MKVTTTPAVVAEAPSNIALIKYMGKRDAQQNQATNSSLSWTLDHLKTRVELFVVQGPQDVWEPLSTADPIELSESGRARFLAHLSFLKNQFGIKENYLVRSGNNFPSDCGLASSASSFAALTRAIQKLCQQTDDLKWARLSQKGSGSSCRSFFPGWCIWNAEEIRSVSLPWAKLGHTVVVVAAEKKLVSSSQAHRQVTTSMNFAGRVDRAEIRLNEILALNSVRDPQERWAQLKQLAWEEFWDMHALFETSRPSFGYLTPDTLRVLEIGQQVWRTEGDGPVVTMDAGPNVHMLWRPDQLALQKKCEEGLTEFRMISTLSERLTPGRVF